MVTQGVLWLWGELLQHSGLRQLRKTGSFHTNHPLQELTVSPQHTVVAAVIVSVYVGAARLAFNLAKTSKSAL